MEKLQLDVQQTYFDEETGDELDLYFDYYQTHIDGIKVILNNVPLLRNTKNSKIFYPQKTKYMIESFIKKAQMQGEKGSSLTPNPKKTTRYTFAEKFEFKYTHIDYEYIPGLMRQWDEGFLTPVFFNIKVLNKYSQDPNYNLDIFSGTYGSISKGNEWGIQFGINKNKKVIIWLGDIDQLPDDEKYYLRSENIDSDHDIHSEFYNAQIEVKWAKPHIESKTFEAKNHLNQIVFKKYAFDLYSFHGEISTILENLNLPLFWTEKHISPFIESLNRIFVESLNSKEIKKNLTDLNPALSGKKLNNMGGLKLFEKWISFHSNDDQAKSLMLPLFVLYDFRIISAHLLSNEAKKEKLESICKRLGIEYEENNFEIIYKQLINKLYTSYQEFNKILKIFVSRE